MAIYFLPQEQNGLAQALGGLTGTAIGALGGYAAQQYSLPDKIKKFESFGFSPEQSKALANSSEAQQTAAIKEAMKAQAANREAKEFKDTVTGGEVDSAQTPTISQPKAPQGGIDALDALGGPEQQPRVPQPGQEQVPDIGKILQGKTVNELQAYRNKVLSSGKNPKMVQNAVAMLDKEIDTKLKERQITAMEEKPLRADIRENVKTWHKESKKADKDIHALNQLAILGENGDFSNHTLRRLMTKAGYGDFFLGQNEEAYKKTVEGLVMDKARELASAGKITAAIFDRVRLRYPSLENSPGGRKVLANILSREAEENKVYDRIYKDIRKKEKWTPGKDPLDIVERVEELAEPELEKMREKSNRELEKEVGGGKEENSDLIKQLTSAHNPKGLPNGAVAKDENGNPIARVVNGKWESQ